MEKILNSKWFYILLGVSLLFAVINYSKNGSDISRVATALERIADSVNAIQNKLK